jgi:hypothetical protein
LKKLYLLCLYLLPIFASAQKNIDLDRFNFTVQYHSLPAMKIDSSYRTYNVVIEGTKLMDPFLKQLSPENTVLLEGWRKLPGNGHLSIKVNLEDLLPESVAIKERSEVTKDRAGVASTKIYYHEEVRYSFAANASINDYKGAHITDLNLASRNNKYTYSSPEFALRPLAEGYFMINAAKLTGDLYRNCVNNAMHYLSENITDNFGFREVSSKDIMWIIDTRKDPEYAAHRKAFQQVSDIFFSMNANTPTEKIKSQLKPVIDYFESLKTVYTGSGKHDRKIRYASYFNLAVLYYYLDDPQAMMNEARGLILNDYDTRDGKNLEATAVWLKNLFQTNNITTRHFNIDINSYKGPYEKDAVTVK